MILATVRRGRGQVSRFIPIKGFLVVSLILIKDSPARNRALTTDCRRSRRIRSMLVRRCRRRSRSRRLSGMRFGLGLRQDGSRLAFLLAKRQRRLSEHDVR